MNTLRVGPTPEGIRVGPTRRPRARDRQGRRSCTRLSPRGAGARVRFPCIGCAGLLSGHPLLLQGPGCGATHPCAIVGGPVKRFKSEIEPVRLVEKSEG